MTQRPSREGLPPGQGQAHQPSGHQTEGQQDVGTWRTPGVGNEGGKQPQGLSPGYEQVTGRAPQGHGPTYDQNFVPGQDPIPYYGQTGSYPGQRQSHGQPISGGHEPSPHQDLYDPDYHQWRAEQMRSFDEDYRNWRQERFRRFSEDFNEWRQHRKQSQAGPAQGSIGDASNKDGQGAANVQPRQEGAKGSEGPDSKE